jgi:hypothetical protein
MTESRQCSLERVVRLSSTLALSTSVDTTPSPRGESSRAGFVHAWRAAARCRLLLLMMFCLILLQRTASAQIQETFTHADGNGLWSVGANWNPLTDSGGPNGDFNVTVIRDSVFVIMYLRPSVLALRERASSRC